MAEMRISPPSAIEELEEALGSERFNSIVDDVLKRYCEAQDAVDGQMHYIFRHDNGDFGFYGDKPGVIKAIEDAVDASGDWPPFAYFEKRNSEAVLDDVRERYWPLAERFEAEIYDRDYLRHEVVKDLEKEVKHIAVSEGIRSLEGPAPLEGISPFEWDDYIVSRVDVVFDVDEILRATVLPVDIELRAANATRGEYDETVGTIHQIVDYALDRCDLEVFETSSLAVLCEQQGFTLGEMLAAGDDDGLKTQLREAVGELIGNENGFCARPVLLASLDTVSFAQLACGEATGVEIDARRATARTEFGACIALFDGAEGSGELVVTAACDRPLVFPLENIETALPDEFDSGALGITSIRDTFGLFESVWDAPCMLCDSPLSPIEIRPEDPAFLASGAKATYDRSMGFEAEAELEEAPSPSRSFDDAAKRAVAASVGADRFAESKKPERQCETER